MRKNYVKYVLSFSVVFGLFTAVNAQTPVNSKDGKLTKKNSTQLTPINKENSTPQKVKDAFAKARKNIDFEGLRKLGQEAAETYAREKQHAIAYAKEHGLAVKMTNQDGSYAELQRVLDDGTPIYYTTFNVDAAESTRADYLNTGGGLGLNVNGNGYLAHVWDGGHARETHQEYDGPGGNNRVDIRDAASEGGLDLNFHAAHVTGTIVSSGQVQAASKGMAWQADAYGYKWSNDVAEGANAASNENMIVSNHSYGYIASGIPDGWFGQYGNDAHQWDEIMYDNPYYLMFVAAGNDGQDNSSNGNPLNGNAAYDKLSGHATAKNNMVVANGQDANINGNGSLNSVSRNTSSSEGPADDYRIKPDIMGNGTGVYSTYQGSNSQYGNISGTSMASPNVCGSALLLQEHYNNVNGSLMRAATLKGLILHTADDTAAAGPDAQTGWGLMNTKFAAETITTANAGGSAIVRELNLSNGGVYSIDVQSDGVNPLLVSISWTDPEGAVNNGTNSSTPALINDLDVRVSNGTTFNPWRLTAVNANGTGDNTVDPYERVDINGASGQYTITVNHKGNIGGGQDFTLIVTGAAEVAATPQVGFNSISGNTAEGSDCSFTDVQIPVSIAQAPSQNADVTFTVNGSGSATSGLDFDLMTTNMTFNSGTTSTQNMTLRIYNDSYIEADETVVVDLSVNPNGGDASANPSTDTLTYTITDDDAAPVASQTFELLNSDFEAADTTAWIGYDEDGDNNFWLGLTGLTWPGITGDFIGSESNGTVLGNGGNFSPDNYIWNDVAITIPAATTNVNFSFGVGGFQDAEPYEVYWTTDVSSAAAINGSQQLEARNTLNGNGEVRSIDVNNIAGQTGHFVIRHVSPGAGTSGIFVLDNVVITATVSTGIQTTVNNGTTNDSVMVNGIGKAHTSDSATGDVIADITNNDTYSYGCTTTSVARAGTGAQSYMGSTVPNLVMDKTFYINPSNTNSSGNVDIEFYFTEAEIAGWEAATGLSRTQLVCLRDDSGPVTFAPDQNTINAVETSTLTIGSFGTNGVTLTGNFSGVSGGFVFGPAAAFNFVQVTPQVYLQGASINPNVGEEAWMRDDLRLAGIIPTTSPYTDALTCNATVFNTTGANAIVDWVWVEVRDGADNTNILGSQSALLQRDGDVVGADGVSPLRFDVPGASYYLTVSHRNHLGIMSANTVALSLTASTVDMMTSSTSILGGTNAVIDEGGRFTMVGGDYDQNNQVQTADVNSVFPLLGGFGYDNGDLDMNGQLQTIDINIINFPNSGRGRQY